MSDCYFPGDVLIQILVKLPVKSLIRFTLVSKSWYSFITSPAFISKHLSQQHNSSLLLRRYEYTHKKEHYELYQDSNNSFKFISQLHFSFDTRLGYFRIVGISNGIICLCDDLFGDLSLRLWNPSIQKVTTLPLPSIRPDSPHMFVLGFGSSNNDDYKLVRLVYLKHDNVYPKYNLPPQVEIYSLNTGVWRRIIGVNIRYNVVEFMWSQAFVYGAVHWMAYNLDDNGVLGNLIMSFSISDEVFGEIMLPDALSLENPTLLSIFQLVGSLAVVKYDRELDVDVSCQVWLMKCYGVFKSWTRLYCINLTPNMGRILGFRNNGQLLFSSTTYELLSWDPNTGNHNALGIYGSPRSLYAQNYMESLVLLQGNNHILDAYGFNA